MRQEYTGRKQHCNTAASYDKAIFQQQVKTRAAAKTQQSTENVCLARLLQKLVDWISIIFDNFFFRADSFK